MAQRRADATGAGVAAGAGAAAEFGRGGDPNPVVVNDPASTAKAVASLQRAAGRDSVAVLPFVNMSSDPEQEYFSDGLAEELLNRLSRAGNLRVAARTSAFPKAPNIWR